MKSSHWFIVLCAGTFLLALLCVGACGTDLPCDYETHNICFYSGQHVINTEQVHAVVSVMDEELAKHYPDSMSMFDVLELSNVHVEITDDDLRDCEPAYDDIFLDSDVYICAHNVSGVNYKGNEIILEWDNAGIWDTALAHELLHTWEWRVTGFRVDHLTPWLFVEWASLTKTDWMETVEAATAYRLSDIFQGE